LKNQTVEKLYDMKLKAMAEAYRNPEQGCDDLDFDDRFSMLVEKEWYAKRNARISRLVARAGFGVPGSIEEIDYAGRRGLTRKDVVALG